MGDGDRFHIQPGSHYPHRLPDSPQPQAAGTAKPALYSFRLPPHELVPFESAIPLQADPRSDTTIDEIDRRRR